MTEYPKISQISVEIQRIVLVQQTEWQYFIMPKSSAEMIKIWQSSILGNTQKIYMQQASLVTGKQRSYRKSHRCQGQKK